MASINLATWPGGTIQAHCYRGYADRTSSLGYL